MPFKKQIFIFLGVLLVLLLGLAALGPRSHLVSAPLSPIDLPTQLDSWLAQQEAKVPGLKPQTDKKIVWAKTPGTPTLVSLVYVHGFSASRREVSPVIDDVARALEANIFFTRLRGHGQDGETLAKAKSREWLEDTEEAFQIGQRIGNRVVLVGTSTGAVLALWAALQHPTVSAVVLLSPNFSPKDKRAKMLLWPAGLSFAKWLTGPVRSWEPENQLQSEIWTSSYPLEAVVPMMETVEFFNTFDLSRLSSPTLLIYTPNDKTIDASLIPARFETLGSGDKKLVRLDEAKVHVLAGDATSPETSAVTRDTILKFLERLKH